MITISVNANLDQLAAAGRTLSDLRPLLVVLQRRAVNAVKEHFLVRNREPNSMGWPKRNFWSREGRDNTGAGAVTADSAEVVVASAAIAHKLSGGTITPKRGKFLAIPLTAEAYKAGSPREGNMPGLFLVRRKGETGRAFLAVADRLGEKPPRGAKGMAPRDRGGIRPQYLLVRSVTQAPDPRTLPPPEAMGRALQAEAKLFISRRIARPA
jgi:hypothetical protein